jgi:hypothetical protein
MNVTKKIIIICGLALFLLPAVVHLSLTWKTEPPVWLGLPHTGGGDEPHYMVVVTSIIRDNDLDVANNYANARHGRNDAGETYRNVLLDHHVYLVDPAGYSRTLWTDVFDADLTKAASLPAGISFARRKGMEAFDVNAMREYMFGQFGLPLFLAAFLWPFGPLEFSTLYDTAALFIILLCNLLGLGIFAKLAGHFQKGKEIMLTGMLALATPVWFYSKVIFPESIFWVILVGALYLVLVKRTDWLAGMLLGYAILIKPGYALCGVVFLVYLARTTNWRRTLQYAGPFLLFIFLQLVNNYVLYRNPLVFSQGNPTAAYMYLTEPFLRLWNILFGSTHGLITFTPFLILGFIFLPALARRAPGGGLIAGLVFVWLFACILPCAPPDPGCTYSARYLLPIVPLLVLGAGAGFDRIKTKPGQIAALIALGFSIASNAQGAFMSGSASGRPPWFSIQVIVNKLCGWFA